MVSSADVPASALDGGSWADRGLLVGACTRACVRGLPCFLVVCCSPARAAHASAHICGVGSGRSRVRSRCVCVPCKRCTTGCLGTKKRHCSGAFRSHDIIYGLSEALRTLAISLECLKVVVRCIESRYLLCTLSLGIRLKTRQGEPISHTDYCNNTRECLERTARRLCVRCVVCGVWPVTESGPGEEPPAPRATLSSPR
jgi:hypothetical protein